MNTPCPFSVDLTTYLMVTRPDPFLPICTPFANSSYRSNPHHRSTTYHATGTCCPAESTHQRDSTRRSLLRTWGLR
jgi:hypothetical protein